MAGEWGMALGQGFQGALEGLRTYLALMESEKEREERRKARESDEGYRAQTLSLSQRGLEGEEKERGLARIEREATQRMEQRRYEEQAKRQALQDVYQNQRTLRLVPSVGVAREEAFGGIMQGKQLSPEIRTVPGFGPVAVPTGAPRERYNPAQLMNRAMQSMASGMGGTFSDPERPEMYVSAAADPSARAAMINANVRGATVDDQRVLMELGRQYDDAISSANQWRQRAQQYEPDPRVGYMDDTQRANHQYALQQATTYDDITRDITRRRNEYLRTGVLPPEASPVEEPAIMQGLYGIGGSPFTNRSNGLPPIPYGGRSRP